MTGEGSGGTRRSTGSFEVRPVGPYSFASSVLLYGANRTVEELKDELVPEELKEVRRVVEEFEDEARRLAVEGLEARVAPRYEPTTVATTDGRGGARAG